MNSAESTSKLPSEDVSDSVFLHQMQEYYGNRPVLVAGADGLLGSHLCHKLSILGANLTILTRKKQSVSAKYAHRVIQGDFEDPMCVQKALLGQEVVFDCVGSLSAVSSMD
ncbi:MAG: NAD-dependent epimerase/dehydratase family protein, partial [Rhodospirillales bacterium]